MSVTAHFTEQLLLKTHSSRLNIRWLLLGAYIPDAWGLDRLFMMFDPSFHRDIGFGWLHTLIVPLFIALPVLFFFGRWAFLSFLLSIELHVLTDTTDTIGVMLLWPFSDHKFSLGWFPWHDQGTLVDLAGYYTNLPALSFEMFFMVWAVYETRKMGDGSVWLGLKRFWALDGWKDPEKEDLHLEELLPDVPSLEIPELEMEEI